MAENETYGDAPKPAPLLRELSWSKHLLFLSRCKSPGREAVLPRLHGPQSLVAPRVASPDHEFVL